eukprot:g2993.t1
MMDPDENDSEELEAVPSDMFDGSPPPASSAALGWAGAAAAGTALFAGVSSRVEGVSSRMSLRAKDMLALSGGDGPAGAGGSGSPVSNSGSPGGARPSGGGGGGGPFGNGYTSVFNGNGNTRSASGILSGIADDTPVAPPPPDENEVSRLVLSLSSSPQLAEKMVAMSKLSGLLGDGAGKSSQDVLHSVAGPLVAVLQDAEHFDPFFANACIACSQQLLASQGHAFAKELVEAGTARALIPLLDPRFELIRIEGLALLEALLLADRRSVCAQVVGVPTGMQALVDLLDDRWDEVRHQGVSLLATFLTEEGEMSPPVDLQNFVAFQDGFDKLFKAVGETSEDVSLRALAALAGALADNPLSRKLFVSGGHLPRLPALLAILKPGDISERPLVQRQQAAAPTARRRWGWGGGRDKSRVANGGKGGAGGGGVPHAAVSPSSGGGGGEHGDGEDGGGGDNGGGGWSGEVPVGRIRAALALVSALVGCYREETGAAATAAAAAGAMTGVKHGLVSPASSGAVGAAEDDGEADGMRAAVGRGLLQAVCELALASTRAPAGGGATWAEYGLPGDCQRSALGILTGLVSRHPANQASFAQCTIRGAPMSMTVHGQKQFVSAEPRHVVDVLLELWLAASSATVGTAAGGVDAKVDAEGAGVPSEVVLLDRALDAFLVGNNPWCKAVFARVSSMHAAAAALGDDLGHKPTRPPADAADLHRSGGSSSSNSSAGNGGGSSNSAAVQNGSRSNGGPGGVAVCDRGTAVGGVSVMSSVLKRGLLCVRSRPSSSSPGPRSVGGDGGDDDPSAAALCLRLVRMVLQAGQADARAVAAGVGVPTAGARRQEEEAAKAALEPAAAEGGRADDGQGGLSPGELGDPSAEAWGSADGRRAGDSRDRGGGGGRRNSVTCGPPLTPALEVALRLLADGYGVAVMFQTTGGPQGGDEGYASPHSDLSEYLISLGELLVTWLSPQGVAPVLSQRLLASGSSWALLRTFGRAIRPDLARKNESPGNRSYSNERGDVAVAGAAGADAGAVSAPSEDPSLAYLHAVVAVVIGSLLSCGEGSLASETLVAGVRAHVGVFDFCRALDAASDWVAFAWPAARETGSRSPVPAAWALAGDRAFSSGLMEIVQAAQKKMIGFFDAQVPGARPPASSSPGGEQGGGGGGDSAATDGGGDGGRREACEQLLRRQQARIEELERRVILPAVAAAAGGGAYVDHVYDAAHGPPYGAPEGSGRPTLTI